MISSRVKEDDDVEPCGDYLIKRVGKRWRVYQDGSYYSQTSGGVMKQGGVMRDAGDKPVSFATLNEAQAWIGEGCRLVDRQGNEIEFK